MRIDIIHRQQQEMPIEDKNINVLLDKMQIQNYFLVIIIIIIIGYYQKSLINDLKPKEQGKTMPWIDNTYSLLYQLLYNLEWSNDRKLY